MAIARHIRPRLVVASFVVAVPTLACSSSEIGDPAGKKAGNVFGGGAGLYRGESEVRPATEPDKQTDDVKLPSGKVTFVDAVYEVTTLFSAPQVGIKDLKLPCQGRVEVKVNVNLDQGSKDQIFDFPEGKFDCGPLGNLDIKKLLGVVGQAMPTGVGGLQVNNNVIYTTEVPAGKFDPPRPIFPSFLAASTKDLSGVDLTVTNAKLVTPKATYTGSFGLKVDYAGVTEAAPGTVDKQLRRVMQFTMSSSGFNGADKLASLLLDYLRIKMNVQPVVIPALEVRAVIGDMLTADAVRNGKIADGFLGVGLDILTKLSPEGTFMGMLKKMPVDIKLKLLKQDGIEEAIARAEANASRVAGGQVTVD